MIARRIAQLRTACIGLAALTVASAGPCLAQEVIPPGPGQRDSGCGFAGLPELTLHELLGKEARYGRYTVRGSGPGTNELKISLSPRGSGPGSTGIQGMNYVGEIGFSVYFPKNDYASFGAWDFLVDGRRVAITRLSHMTQYGLGSFTIVEKPMQAIFAQAIASGKTLTFVTRTAQGKVLTSTSFDVSNFSRSLRALAANGFRCEYRGRVRQDLLALHARDIASRLVEQPMEVERRGQLTGLTGVELTECRAQLKLADGTSVAIPMTKPRMVRSDRLAYLVLSDQPPLRIFAKGTREGALAPPPAAEPARRQDPLMALMGRGGPIGGESPSARRIGDVFSRLNAIVSICAP